MSHAKNKFVKASNQGGEPTAERFSGILKEFFMRERNVMMADLPRESGYGKGKAWKRKDS